MDSYFRGTMWMILILFTLPHLTCDMVCPSSCQCTFNGAVKCVGYTISDIPKNLPPHTSLLQVDNTNMKVINQQSLADKVPLLRFSLTKSHLHTIHPRAFQVAPQLKSVKLSSNDLSTLPARVFSPLTTLEQLYLDGNQLEILSPDMFEGLVKLLVMDLSRNKLSNLASDIFDGLTELRFLNLGRNTIKKLPPTIFHSLTKLTHLMLYNNELQSLEVGMFDGLNLEELKIHQNQISSIPPQVFWPLRNLDILTLSSNQLTAIPEESFYNKPLLKKLTIYKNPLLSLPDQLMGHMPIMTEFYLYATNLTTVPGNLFANMSGLLSLNFHLNEWLHELPSDLFCCLPNLHKLSLKSNNLTDLHPQLFSRLTKLSILVLSDNKLQSLPEDIFQGLAEVSSLSLNNNQLTTLPGDIFLSNTALKFLNLSGNPWDCTCHIRGIANWIKHNEQVVVDRVDVLCESPQYQMLRTLGSLSDEEFNFCHTTSVTSYFPTQTHLHEPTKPLHTTSTGAQTSTVASTTTTPKTSTTTQETTQQVTTQQPTPTAKPSRILSTPPENPTTTLPNNECHPITHDSSNGITDTPSTTFKSPPFYDKLVVEQRPEFVHHNHHKGWVYVWFLPSNTALVGFLMFFHILLVATGLFLILAALYGLYRLNKIMVGLNVKRACT